VAASLGILFALSISGTPARTQSQSVLNADQQDLIAGMLQQAYHDIKDFYYDPKLKGLDWDSRYRQYSGIVAKAHDLNEGYSIVAAFMNGLDDSHTFFVPPGHATQYKTGFRYALFGDACFITRTRPGSDAAVKMKVGDQILKLDGYDVKREDFHDVQYFFNYFAPQAIEELLLRSINGNVHEVTVMNVQVTRNRQSANFDDPFTRQPNDVLSSSAAVLVRGDTAIWRVKEFNQWTNGFKESTRDIREPKAIILDLRENPGGPEETLKTIVSMFFDHDVKIADRVTRLETKPIIAKPDKNPFKGKLIVLVDSGTASASELFARVVQLEHRGIVIGDKTAGAVMEAQVHSEQRHTNTDRISYGFSVTEANLIMTDGKSLEKVGVAPDELMIPTAEDLAGGRDPVMARAAQLAGLKLYPHELENLFPFEWPKP
jgi:carboxyl-terminal processing protease